MLVRWTGRVKRETLSTAFHNYGDIRLAMHPAGLRCSSVAYSRLFPIIPDILPPRALPGGRGPGRLATRILHPNCETQY